MRLNYKHKKQKGTQSLNMNNLDTTIYFDCLYI